MEETTEIKKEEHSTSYGKRPMWQWIAIYVVIGIVVYGAIYYFMSANKGGGGYNYQQPNTQIEKPTSPPTENQPTSSSTTSETTQTINVEGNEFAFTPSTITVKQGQPINIIFKNTGKYPHNFTISDLSVQTSTVQPGEQTQTTFTPTKTGSFEYICTVPSHADKGMKGTLTVQ